MVKPKTSEKLISLAKSPFNWINVKLNNLYSKFVWSVFVAMLVVFVFSLMFACYVTGQPKKKVTTRYYVYELTPTEASNVTHYISQQRLLPSTAILTKTK